MSSDERQPWLPRYLREPTFWPVALVLYAHAVLALGIAMLDAVRRDGTLGFLVLAATAGVTVWAVARDWSRRHIGPATPSLLALWLLGALSAWGADSAGLY